MEGDELKYYYYLNNQIMKIGNYCFSICFITFIVYHHYYFSKLDYSDVVILVFWYAGWITQELLL